MMSLISMKILVDILKTNYFYVIGDGLTLPVLI